MASSSSGAELERQLKDAGTSLLQHSASTDELLNRLDRLENLLTNVEQTPAASVEEALYPAMKALISNKLLRHSDMDVKVSVVTCITEITRITAPNAPFDDDQMKEIFKLTVATFEKLSQGSGRCYTKAMFILDTIARVRSCLVMLDLECDALVLEMFQHFLKHIRSGHPPAVFSAMEAVMTLMIDESEEIPSDLLSLLLSSVRKENQKISPVSSKLGENVITLCASTLKPYLQEAVNKMCIDTNDYAQIVASICQNGTGNPEHNSVEDSENNLDTMGLAPNVVIHRKADQTAKGIIRSIGKQTVPTRNDDNVLKRSPQKLQHGRLIKHPKGADSIDIAETSSLLSLKKGKSKIEPDSTQRMRAQKPNFLMITEEGHPKGAVSRGIAGPNNSLSIKAEKLETQPDSTRKKRGQKRNSLQNPEGGHPKRAESRVIAEPKNSFSIKTDKTQSDPDTALKKRGQKSNSLMGSNPDTSISIKAEKSECEPDSIPRKRGRKPNSLMNPEEGYDHSWLSGGKKSLGPARRRNSCGKSNESSPSRNSVSKKRTSSSTLANVIEPAVLQSELVENIGASPSKNHILSEEAHSKSGRPKRKESTLNQEAATKSLLPVETEVVSSQVEEKTPKLLDLNLKAEPEDTTFSEVKEEGNSTKLGFAAKENEDTAVASARVIAHKETEVCFDPEEKLQQSTLKLEAAKVNAHSLVPRATKKRKRVSNSSNNVTDEESALKNVNSVIAIKSSNGDKSFLEKSTKTLFKRKHIIGKEEASETSDLAKLSLVGKRIKVWWPMDKMFYEGLIDSYDPVKKRHQVSYLDGDREILNLKRQRWELIEQDASADEDQKTDLPRPDASSYINSQKEKQTTEFHQEKEAKKSDQVKQEQVDSPCESNPQKGIRRRRLVPENQAKKSDQAKVPLSSKRNSPRKVQKRKTESDQEKQAKKLDQAKGDPSSKSNPQKRVRKTGSGQKREAKQSDEVKQSKADSTSERIEMPAPVSNKECTTDTKSMDGSPSDNPAIKDEPLDERLKDDGQISPSNLEADALKSTSDCRQVTPETIALSKGKSPEVDTEFGGKEDANKPTEMSESAKSEKTMDAY